MQYWPRPHRHVFAGKPVVVVSNMPSSLIFKRVQYHRRILNLLMLAREFNYGLRDSYEHRLTLTGTTRLPPHYITTSSLHSSFSLITTFTITSTTSIIANTINSNINNIAVIITIIFASTIDSNIITN